MKSILLTHLSILFLCINSIYAAQSDINQTQAKIKRITLKIDKLEKTLKAATNKKDVLDKELQYTESRIGVTVKKLNHTHTLLQKNSKQIEALNQKVKQLNKELKFSQSKLADNIRYRYQMGEYQPLKWMLNQENPNKISQLLTYYSYLIQSQKVAIKAVQSIKTDLAANQVALNEELTVQKKLEANLTKQQSKLEQDKLYRIKLIENLDKDISNKQKHLAEFQQDKNNLTKLLIKLNQQSKLKVTQPFSRMKHKLPLPVHVSKKQIDKANQGIMFYAPEGIRVNSVYPGKIVFSDWLRGYGLLIIIDHGRGYMTLYAHNQSLFKQKGESVGKGEQIATVGHSGGLKKNGLYFEIRHRGKAISPLNWLS